ncbi:helix-turn-helix transcriptional regulator [Salipiger abyssi]|uniref:helix-turn-helix transcriptional regulator n=1 Tax=Salipiger abyssi TaxID=1250539 RepID=UPI000975D2CD|nr:helix-turn-helix domain-containing protein [Salipiger abyssi]
MPAARPLAVKDTSAAKMLDMSADEFRRLVSVGALPSPCDIGGLKRWRTDDIEAILQGGAAVPDEDFEL